MSDLIQQLQDFIGQKRVPRAKWLADDVLQVYIRYSRRYVNRQVYECLDIANVGAEPKGTGAFTRFFEELEKLNPYPMLYLECCHNERLARWFMRRGFVRDTQPGKDPTCYYRFSNADSKAT